MDIAPGGGPEGVESAERHIVGFTTGLHETVSNYSPYL
jgi:hypothetical protein